MSICSETICTYCLHKDVCCFKGAFLETLEVLQDELECINIGSITCKYRIGKPKFVELEIYNGKPIMLCTKDNRVYYADSCNYIANGENSNLDILRIYNSRIYGTKHLDFYRDEIKGVSELPKEDKNVY